MPPDPGDGSPLERDRRDLLEVLRAGHATAAAVADGLDERSVVGRPGPVEHVPLSDEGGGAAEALATFVARYDRHLSASAGPRYLGFVTGGVTPAALVGDWLATVYDQNVAQRFDSVAQAIEDQTIDMLCDLLSLPAGFGGSLVSGATTSNLTGLALGRQWVGRRHGRDVAADGLGDLRIPVLSGSPHASTAKALATLGLGRSCIQPVARIEGREAIDVTALQERLEHLDGTPAIVVASAGTVNTADFDDLEAIAALRSSYPFWLHVDGAFGAFAALSPGLAHRIAGLGSADSVCVDAHKWLNVPYDSAALLTPHVDLQPEVFSSAATYLGEPGVEPDAVHLTPQSSRRFRALPLWMSLVAYGRAGQRDIVERCCTLARDLGRRIDAHPEMRLLAPVTLNIVCFTLGPQDPTSSEVDAWIERINASGEVLITGTELGGVPAVRAAFSNWRTTTADVDRVWSAISSGSPGSSRPHP